MEPEVIAVGGGLGLITTYLAKLWFQRAERNFRNLHALASKVTEVMLRLDILEKKIKDRINGSLR